MALKKLEIKNFRCFKSLEFDLSLKSSLFWGNNGCGKSSVLEAIYILCTGKSFRTSILDSAIKRGEEGFSLTALTDSSKRFYITKVRNQPISIKINDKKVTALELLKYNPLLSIDHSTYFYNDSNPEHRRKHLDRALFSVYSDYSQNLLNFYHTLRLRNLSLKKSSPKDANAWNVSLAETGDNLTKYRNDFVTKSKTNFINILNQSSHPKAELYKDIKIAFNAGFSETSFLDTLTKNISQDLFKKVTSEGPHRADIKFLFDNRQLKHSFSRGEQKVIAIMWSLSFAETINQLSSSCPLITLDDLGSEIDPHHLELLYPLFNKFENQLMFSNITSLFDSKIENPFNNFKMFHVEQLN